MLACVIVAEWIVKDNSQIYKNHHNFLKKHFITISHIKKLNNVVRYVHHVFREHQAIHETCDFFESLFSLVKLFVRYTLFSRASMYCTKLFLTLSEVWCLLVLCLRSYATSKSVLRYTHTHIHTRMHQRCRPRRYFRHNGASCSAAAGAGTEQEHMGKQ